MPEKLRAYITACKPSFLQKCISFNEKFEDAFNKDIYTNFTVFVPKLTPKYVLPVVMVNISNGRSSVLMRLENPLLVKQKLEKIIGLINTDLFNERWERISSHSDILINNGFLSTYDKLYFHK